MKFHDKRREKDICSNSGPGDAAILESPRCIKVRGAKYLGADVQAKKDSLQSLNWSWPSHLKVNFEKLLTGTRYAGTSLSRREPLVTQVQGCM